MRTVRLSLVLALGGVFFNSCSHTDPSRSPASTRASTQSYSESEYSIGADLLETAEETPLPRTSENSEKEIDPWVRVAQSEIDPDGRRSCAISALLISYLDESSEKEMGESAQAQIEELKNFYGSHPNKLQKKILKDLERIARHETGKDDFRKVFSSLCKVGRAVGGTFIRTSALTASAVTSALTLPIRFTFKAGIGTFTRKRTPEKGVGYSEVLGGRGLKNWSSSIYQTIRVAFFSGNPLLLGVYGLTSIDLQVQTLCRSTTLQKSDREVKFCANYEAIKKGEFAMTEEGEKLGVKLGKFLLHTFDFRADGIANPKICEKSAKRQIKISLRAKERLEDELDKNGFKNFVTEIVPPEVGGCVQMKIQFEKKAEREQFEAKNSSDASIDGVSVMVLASKEEEEAERKREEEERALALGEKRKAAPLADDPTPTPAPDFSDEKLCKTVFSMQAGKALYGKEAFSLSMKLLQFSLNPVRFASLELKNVTTPAEKLRQEPASARGQGKNVVYIVSPNAKQRKEYEEISKKQESIQAEVKEQAKKFKTLMKEKSFERCLSKQEEIGFDWKKYEELSKSLREMSVAQRVTDFDALLKEAKKSGKRLFVLNSRRMEWEIREYRNINQFREALTSDDIRNVVFVSHADSVGKIIDSNLNLVPASAFSWINPNIQSVSLFACHTDQLIRTFHLDDQLRGQESYFPLRYIGMVDANEMFERKNQAPSPALSEFLEDLDRELYRAEVGNERAQTVFGAQWPKYEKPALCEFSFPGTRASLGAFHIQFVADGVTKYWAGVMDPENSEQGTSFKVPCPWIGKKMIFGLENANPVTNSTLESQTFRLQLKDQTGAAHVFEPYRVGRRENQTVNAVKWKFDQVSEEGGVTVWKDYGSPEALKPAQDNTRGN